MDCPTPNTVREYCIRSRGRGENADASSFSHLQLMGFLINSILVDFLRGFSDWQIHSWISGNLTSLSSVEGGNNGLYKIGASASPQCQPHPVVRWSCRVSCAEFVGWVGFINTYHVISRVVVHGLAEADRMQSFPREFRACCWLTFWPHDVKSWLSGDVVAQVCQSHRGGFVACRVGHL